MLHNVHRLVAPSARLLSGAEQTGDKLLNIQQDELSDPWDNYSKDPAALQKTVNGCEGNVYLCTCGGSEGPIKPSEDMFSSRNIILWHM